MIEAENFYVNCAVPISSGPGFLTPLFSNQSSNSLYLQDIAELRVITKFNLAPMRAVQRSIPVSSWRARSVGDAPLLGFRDTSGGIMVAPLVELEPILAKEFHNLSNHPNLQRSIARTLKDENLLAIALGNLEQAKSLSSGGTTLPFPLAAETSYMHDRRGAHFPRTAEMIRQLLYSAGNSLLVGARGMGKTHALQFVRNEYVESGRTTLWLSGRHSDVPLEVALAIAQAPENSKLHARVRGLIHSVGDPVQASERVMRELQEVLAQLYETLQRPNVTIFIDDLQNFTETFGWQGHFDNRAFLSRLFRSSGANVIAATSDILGWNNSFTRHIQGAPYEGQDYRVLYFRSNDGQLGGTSSNESYFYDFVRSIDSYSNVTLRELRALVEYSSSVNPRRLFTFLNDACFEGNFSQKSLREIHHRYLSSILHVISDLFHRIGTREVRRQIATIIEASRKESEAYQRRALQAGRQTSLDYLPGFRVNFADDVSVLGWLLMSGILELQMDHTHSRPDRVRFISRHDRDWLETHFLAGNTDGGPGTDDRQPRLL